MAETRNRLKVLGVRLKEPWERDLNKLCKRYGECDLELNRLWIAALIQQAAAEGGITADRKAAIDLLRQAAFGILAVLPPKDRKVETIVLRVREWFLAHGLCDSAVHALMEYWPAKACFDRVRAVRTVAALEQLRRRLDYSQATQELERTNRRPTGPNQRRLVHQNITKHVNDSQEQLPGIVVSRASSEELKRLIRASVSNKFGRKKGTPVTVDFRDSQNGLSLRTFRARYARKKSSQRDIVNAVFDVRDTPPGVPSPREAQRKKSSVNQ